MVPFSRQEKGFQMRSIVTRDAALVCFLVCSVAASVAFQVKVYDPASGSWKETPQRFETVGNYASAAGDVSGTWQLGMKFPDAGVVDMVMGNMRLTQAAANVTGSINGRPISGTIRGSSVTFAINFEASIPSGFDVTFTGRVVDSKTMSGTVTFPQYGKGTWSATRITSSLAAEPAVPQVDTTELPKPGTDKASATTNSARTVGPSGPTIRVVSIDIQKAVLDVGKPEFEALRKKFQPQVDELQKLKAEIEDLKKQLSTQGDNMTDEARASLLKSIETKQNDMQRRAGNAQKDYQAQQDEIAQRILTKMSPILIKYVQENRVDAVIDTSVVRHHDARDLQEWPNGPLMWKAPSVDKYVASTATPKSDMTAAIIAAYNGQEQTTDVIVADPKMLSFINSLGPSFVFFTSREHPISRLTDITDPETQLGVAEFSPRMMALRQLIGSGSVTGASLPPAPTGQPSFTGAGVEFGGNGTLRPLTTDERPATYESAGGVTLMGIGEDGFGKLFQQHPQLKLFVTPSGIAGIDAIVTTGGGMRVHFVESK